MYHPLQHRRQGRSVTLSAYGLSLATSTKAGAQVTGRAMNPGGKVAPISSPVLIASRATVANPSRTTMPTTNLTAVRLKLKATEEHRELG
jgi:hypothetical protein